MPEFIRRNRKRPVKLWVIYYVVVLTKKQRYKYSTTRGVHGKFPSYLSVEFPDYTSQRQR